MAPNKGVMAKTRAKITEAAKRDARGVKTLAGEAVSAAAMAAAGVVLQGVAKALGRREQKPQEGRHESRKKTTSKRAVSTKQRKTKTKSRGKAVNKKASKNSR